MENKHTAGDLKQMQSLPLSAKITMTKNRIRQWYEYWDGQVYVSFSGGKDSTVLKHLVDSMYDDVPAVFVNTGLEYPEIQKFVNEVKAGNYEGLNTDVEIIRPEMRFDDVIKKYGYPVVSKQVANTIYEARKSVAQGCTKYTYRLKRLNGELLDKDGKKSLYNCEKWKFLMDADFKISDRCCHIMKKKPAMEYEKTSKRKPYIGTMADESMLRKQQWVRYGCNEFDSKRMISKPLSFWTEQDILQYLKQNNLPYCSVYGDIVEQDGKLKTTGCDRTGCMFCMFGVHLEKQPNRFQRMKITHPIQYEYCMNKLGLKEVLEYINVPYE